MVSYRVTGWFHEYGNDVNEVRLESIKCLPCVIHVKQPMYQLQGSPSFLECL